MKIKLEEELEVQKSCDVLVLGGGVSGVAAAVSASRHGKKVILIEKSIKLGGLATLGLVNMFVPMCDGEGNVLTRGLCLEFVELAMKYGFNTLPKAFEGKPNMPKENLEKYKAEGKLPPRYCTVISAEIFSLMLTELCVKENITLMFDTVVTKPYILNDNPNKIEGVIIENKDGRGIITAKQYVDATGDADLVYRLGVPCVERGNYHSFFSFEVNMDTIQKALETKRIDKIYTFKSGGGVNLYGSNDDGKVPLYYGTHNSEINRYIINNHRDLLEKIKSEDKFSRDIVTMPDMCQFRTTRRIESDYVLSEDDFNVRHEDSIAAVPDFDHRTRFLEIPYASLIKSGFPNVITAGRIIGAKDFAWDVTRVIPPAIITGQVAGVAASMAIDENKSIDTVDVPSLQKVLEKDDVVIHLDKKFLTRKIDNKAENNDRA